MNFIFPRSHLAGMWLSAAGGTGTFGISAGQCTDDANTVIMNAGSAFTKTTAAFAEGTGNGALLDSGSIANSQWYHVFAMERPDTHAVDYGVSTSLTPTLPTNYTTSRRIGSMLTDSSGHWTGFTQVDDLVLWNAALLILNSAAIGTTPTLHTLNTPLGVQTIAIVDVGGVAGAGSDARGGVYSPDNNSGSIYNLGSYNGTTTNQSWSTTEVRTNLSSQIYMFMASANGGAYLQCRGYYDRRGKGS